MAERPEATRRPAGKAMSFFPCVSRWEQARPLGAAQRRSSLKRTQVGLFCMVLRALLGELGIWHQG